MTTAAPTKQNEYGEYFLLDDGALKADRPKYDKLVLDAFCKFVAQSGLSLEEPRILTMTHQPRWDHETGEFIEYNDSIGWKAKVKP